MAALKALPEPWAKQRIEELLELVDLKDCRKQRLRTCSGGMLKRVGIAQALLNEPEILVLDEPTAGLDPKERVRFRNICLLYTSFPWRRFLLRLWKFPLPQFRLWKQSPPQMPLKQRRCQRNRRKAQESR